MKKKTSIKANSFHNPKFGWIAAWFLCLQAYKTFLFHVIKSKDKKPSHVFLSLTLDPEIMAP